VSEGVSATNVVTYYISCIHTKKIDYIYFLCRYLGVGAKDYILKPIKLADVTRILNPIKLSYVCTCNDA
jgi:hypothetical protein